MRISTDEQRAIQQVVNAGEAYGFGNMIAHLQTAWAKSLVTEYGMDEATARLAAGGDGYPFAMHDDLREGGFWDETGNRYADTEETE